MSEHGADWLGSLNAPQRAAVEHVHGPLLVLAGAGSGKTRVLTTRIASLIERHGVPPDRIFAVTFTNKAAGEMKERIGRLLQRDPSGLWIGTFHSLGARLLRREAPLLGFTSRFTIYDQDDSQALVRRLLEQRGHPPKLFAPRTIQGIISAAKNRMQRPEALRAASVFDRVSQVAAEIYEALGPALQAANAMDFDDLLLHPLTLFAHHPDRLAYYSHKFQFVLVDEFQDTNKAQYELVRLMGSHGNVTAVGDDDQSIYGWRGADVRNMRDFQRDFPSTQLVRLEENYRSTSAVLAAANAVIAENSGRIGKTLHTRRSGGESLTLVAAADERDEAEWIVRELERRRAAGDWALEDMAVLYRPNAQSRAFEEALRRAGMPYRLIGAISFYDRREVRDVLAYLRLVANPADDEAFLRSINTPRRGLGQSSLAILAEAAATWKRPLLDVAGRADGVPELRPNVRSSLRGFHALLSRLAAMATDAAPAVLLEEILRETAFESYLLEEGPEGAERWENVRELLASAANWSEVATPGDSDTPPVSRFLAEAALLSANDKDVGDERGVTLMTLHTAKGLEWPVVVLAGMEDGLFPLGRAAEQPDGIEEERRLAYVGLTRAKDKLYLSWARARRRGGELRPGVASRFLRALPPDLVDEQRTSSLWAPDWGSASSGRYGRQPSAASRWLSGTRGPSGARSPARAAADAPEEASQDVPRYVKGERVRHRRFGSGTIQGLMGSGRDLKVSVAFDEEEVGVKQLLVAYAGLEREWESA